MNEHAARQHVTVLAALMIGFSAVFVLIGLMVATILPTVGLYSEEPGAGPILGTIGVIVGLFFLALSVPGVVAGVGLLRRRPWARVFSMILSGVYALNVPIGTLFAVYAIWVLVQNETERLFSEAPPADRYPDIP